MTDTNKALLTLWSSFSVPAYLDGHVPRGSALPYITFEVIDGDSFSTNILTAHTWHDVKTTSGFGAAAKQRADLLDKIAEAIPPEGRLVSLTGGGYLMIRRGSTFQQYYDPAEDPDVIGSRVAVEITFLTR